MEQCFLIENITEYGKFIAYCIERDISVFRVYWDEREKGDRCYKISFTEKRCYYSNRSYYESVGIQIFKPVFSFNEYGKIILNYISLD